MARDKSKSKNQDSATTPAITGTNPTGQTESTSIRAAFDLWASAIRSGNRAEAINAEENLWGKMNAVSDGMSHEEMVEAYPYPVAMRIKGFSLTTLPYGLSVRVDGFLEGMGESARSVARTILVVPADRIWRV